MTLNEGQDHPKCYKNVQFSGLYHCKTFERDRSVMSECQAMLNFSSDSNNKITANCHGGTMKSTVSWKLWAPIQ